MHTEKIRIYPNKSQRELINRILWNCKELYNYFLQLNIDQYNKDKTFIWKYDLIKHIPEFKFDEDVIIYSQVKQNVASRMDDALNRVKIGNHFPKFKSYNQYRSFTYPQASGFKLQPEKNRIRLGKFGSVKAVFTREFYGKVKTCSIKKMRSDKYYAFVTFDDKDTPQPIPVRMKGSIGIDLGVSKFITTHEGDYIASSRFLRKNMKKLAEAQRKLSRSQKDSNNHQKARHRVARIYEKITNCKIDFLYKVAYYLAHNYDEIVCEKLIISEMIKRKSSAMRRAISDQGIGKFLEILKHTCQKYSCKLTLVDPQYTSQICSNCGTIVKKDLSVRVHKCPHCGLEIDRDVNAAINILQRGKNIPVGTTGGMQVPMLVEMIIPGV